MTWFFSESKSEGNTNIPNLTSNTQGNNNEKSKLFPIDSKFLDGVAKSPVKKCINDFAIRKPSREPRKNLIAIDTVLCHPGRNTRPQK